MKKINSFLALLLISSAILTSCSIPSNKNDKDKSYSASPFPESSFEAAQRSGVIGSVVQTGDGNAYVNGSAPSPVGKASLPFFNAAKGSDDNLVTFEHSFGYSCVVSGYIGNSLYIIQDFGSLAENKKGIGHKDGTVILEYGEKGYFSISSFNENKLIVGNPIDYDPSMAFTYYDSFMFGYMVYDPDTRELTPMYKENNLRFYTAGYFINGVAQVSIKKDGKVLFGIINEKGEYVVEPKYEMMADESINNAVIVASSASAIPHNPLFPVETDPCGRRIWYDSTLMTDVQKTREYECKSQTVGLISTLTGESILPCNYAFIERVIDNTYFVIDNEGKKSLYNADNKSFSTVEEGVYTYFNSEFMLFIIDNFTAYLADKDLNLYEITGLHVEDRVTESNKNATQLINTNVISAERDFEAKNSGHINKYLDTRITAEFNLETSLYTVTVTENGETITDVNSYTYPYNDGFLYAKDNSLFRYDLKNKTSVMIETGYGNFTEDYNGYGEEYYTSIGELDEGLFTLRYNTQIGFGTSYFMVVINDMGEVLFETSINAIEPLSKNYLGKYDEALYEIAGSTSIEDNYFLTRYDGSHFLIQFVRGERSDNGGISSISNTRIVDCHSTIGLLSPFMLDFKDGSNIKVTVAGVEIPKDHYVYDEGAQSLKILTRMFDSNIDILDKMRQDRFLEILVTSGDESRTLRIELTKFSFDL